MPQTNWLEILLWILGFIVVVGVAIGIMYLVRWIVGWFVPGGFVFRNLIRWSAGVVGALIVVALFVWWVPSLFASWAPRTAAAVNEFRTSNIQGVVTDSAGNLYTLNSAGTPVPVTDTASLQPPAPTPTPWNVMQCDPTDQQGNALDFRASLQKEQCVYFSPVTNAPPTAAANAAAPSNNAPAASAPPDTSAPADGTVLDNKIAAPANAPDTSSLKYDETGCPTSANAATCSGNPAQYQFPAIFVRNIQSSDKSIVDGIVAIQKLSAASGVPSKDKWTEMSADPRLATFVWCPAGNCTWVPDSAFPLMGIAVHKDNTYKIGIVSAHMPGDPQATILRVTCPNADCWSVLLK